MLIKLLNQNNTINKHMKATSKQINEAHSLLKAIAMILNIQNNQNIFGEGLEILYSALQEVEVYNETYESNT